MVLTATSGATSSSTTHICVQVANAGTVEAETGIIAFQTGYSNSSSANLATSLGSSTPASGYGRIQFSSPLTFDGTFSVSTRNGYRPNPGDTFAVLNYPSVTNIFSCMSGLDLGAGLWLLPQLTATSLTLTAATYATNTLPRLFISVSPNNVLLTWPPGFPGWILQSCTNLGSPSWAPVSQACGNSAPLPITAPKQFFRLKQ